MSSLDFIVLVGTLFFIAAYGVWKTRGSKSLKGYLKGGNSMKWGAIGLSVMATQASAITFLSTPGLAYESGMAFVQNYFGLPLALIIISVVFIPIYYRLKVYTAYEFLESRFDLKTRQLGAFLFLVQRGLAAGITVYAPAIIVSTILGWDLNLTILMVGIVVIIYTVTGGSRAVSLTQKYQMGVIMVGMMVAFFMVILKFPEGISFGEAVAVAGKMGKLEVVDFSFDINKRYTFWSGMFGGFILALSYFGTDQSQVQRYLTGKNITESRMGLMFNAVLKVPMQFFILFVGVMVFIFYQFEKPPVFFKQTAMESAYESSIGNELRVLDDSYTEVFAEKKESINTLIEAMKTGREADIEMASSELMVIDGKAGQIRNEVKALLVKTDPTLETKDSDYVFLTFILNYLPHGVIGLLLAVIFCAAMSSTASELNALASTSTVDFYKRIIHKNGSERHYVLVSKILTAFWGGVAIFFAMTAYLVENLIEAVNILGSIFYGTILGIFLVAFFVRFIKGNAVFFAALISESLVLFLFYNTDIGYLWYNLIGLAGVIIFGLFLQVALPRRWKG